ncbi:hypothetical protein Holit_03257 [Hollandina sp. SP2]
MPCMKHGGSFYFLSGVRTSSMMMEGKLKIAGRIVYALDIVF